MHQWNSLNSSQSGRCRQPAPVCQGEIDIAASMAKMLEEYGAGEIILQSIPRDGTLKGYDLPLIEAVSESVGVPVVASGGCVDYQDMYNAVIAGASAVAAGALFQFTDCTPSGAAKYLHEAGLEVRYDPGTTE